MEFGVCAGPEEASWAAEAGADFIEGLVQPVLKPAEKEWTPPVPPGELTIPLPVYNCFFPGSMKITGPEVDLAAIAAYARRTCERAAAMGSEMIVFGSGAARKVPDGWPRDRAEDQLVEAMRTVGPIARAAGVTIVMEPLHRPESNILNTVAEGMDYVRRADAAGLAMLVDFFHLAIEREPLANLEDAAPQLVHVHIAEPEGRTPPRPGGTDFRPFLAKLKAVGYDRRISIECKWNDKRKELAPTLEYLRNEWHAV